MTPVLFGQSQVLHALLLHVGGSKSAVAANGRIETRNRFDVGQVRMHDNLCNLVLIFFCPQMDADAPRDGACVYVLVLRHAALPGRGYVGATVTRGGAAPRQRSLK